jgi:hypothetical protein
LLFWIILIVALALLIVFLIDGIGLVIFHATTTDSENLVWIGTIFIASVVIGPIWFLAFRLVRRSNRHRWLSVEELLSKDQRPPVLYLRSFDADKQTDRVDSGISALASTLYFPYAINRLVNELRGSTDEMMWSAALSGIGPLVAVAAPGQLPFRGAARLFIGDGDWQHVVSSLAGKAMLTVVMGGETEGLWWEIRNIVRALPEDRVLYLLPNDEARFAEFRTRMLRELDIDIGEKPKIAHRMTVCGVLQLIRGETHLTPVWGSGQASIDLALEPIVKKLAVG